MRWKRPVSRWEIGLNGHHPFKGGWVFSGETPITRGTLKQSLCCVLGAFDGARRMACAPGQRR